jgi:ABC-type nitrate/sulfonate/bicarbonate transport system substrate-binding protein
MGFSAYVARRDWLAANGDTARKFLAGAAKAVDFLYDPANRAACVTTLVQSAKIDPPTAEKVYDYYVKELKPFSPSLAVSTETIQGGLAQLGDIAAAARNKPVAAFTDLRFLPA